MMEFLYIQLHLFSKFQQHNNHQQKYIYQNFFPNVAPSVSLPITISVYGSTLLSLSVKKSTKNGAAKLNIKVLLCSQACFPISINASGHTVKKKPEAYNILALFNLS